jgi:hypothetical protein
MVLSSRFAVFCLPTFLRLGGLLACVSVAAASQPWDHDAANWTTKDAERILNGSPWVQAAAVRFPQPERQPAPAPLPGAGAAGMAGGNAATLGRWDGSGAPIKDSSPPMLSVAVRWDSALPVRLAAAKSHDRLGLALTPEMVAKDYVITVIGLVPARAYRQNASNGISTNDDSKDVRNPENMLESFMGASKLFFADKSIQPEDVKFDSATGEVHFFFPRDPGLDKKVKEIRFRTIYGSLTVDKIFRTRDMVYKGSLEL